MITLCYGQVRDKEKRETVNGNTNTGTQRRI